MPEQFHLSRLQVINWGVFDGYHTIPFGEGGALIAGASGSGKSSLLDAISLGFLPFNRRNFNASGDNSAAGSNAGRRTVDKYVRGAWGQRSDGGASKVMYLRGDGTAWSAVAVTYTSNTGTHHHRPGAQMAHRRIPVGLLEPVRPGRRRPRHRGRLQPVGLGPLRRGRLQGRRLAILHQGGVAVPRPALRDHRHPRLRCRPAAARQGQVTEKCWRTGAIRPRVHARRARQPDPAARSAQADRPPGRRPRALGRRATQAQDPRRHREDPAALRLGVLRPGHHRSGRSADGAGVHRSRPAVPVPSADRLAGRHHRPTRQRVRGRHPPAQSRQGRRGFAQRTDQRVECEHRAAAVAGGRRRGAGRGGLASTRRLRIDDHRAGPGHPGHRRRVLESA